MPETVEQSGHGRLLGFIDPAFETRVFDQALGGFEIVCDRWLGRMCRVDWWSTIGTKVAQNCASTNRAGMTPDGSDYCAHDNPQTVADNRPQREGENRVDEYFHQGLLPVQVKLTTHCRVQSETKATVVLV